MNSRFTGLLATAMAVGLMASFGAFASNGKKVASGDVHSLDATVFVRNGSDLKTTKKAHVSVSIQPLTGKARCLNPTGKEYPKTNVDGDPAYQLDTSADTGDKFGTMYLAQCERGVYQVSVSLPTGYHMYEGSQQHQTVRLEKTKNLHVEFILDR